MDDLTLRVWWSSEDEAYLARVVDPDWSLMAHGDTPSAAVDALLFVIAASEEDGGCSSIVCGVGILRNAW